MSRNKKQQDRISNHVIYILCSPYDNNVYLGHCGAAYLKNTYSKHYNLHHKQTSFLFQKAKEDDLPVHMFLLETVECSTRQLFPYTVAWAKHLLESGFSLGLSSSLIPYTSDLFPKTENIYECIKEQEISNLIAPEKSLFPNYKKAFKTTSSSIPDQIKIRVKPQEYNKIAQDAKQENLSISRFCKWRILRRKIIEIDTTYLSKIPSRINEVAALLQQILLAIYTTRCYYPVDLKIIQESVDEVRKIHHELILENTKILEQILNS